MKTKYHSLDSEKYMMQSLLNDQKNARRRARASFGAAIWNTTIIALAAVAGFYAIKTMPDWLPTVQTTFHEVTSYRYY